VISLLVIHQQHQYIVQQYKLLLHSICGEYQLYLLISRLWHISCTVYELQAVENKINLEMH